MTTTHYHPCTADCPHGMTYIEVAHHAHEVRLAEQRAQREEWKCTFCRTQTEPGHTVCAACADIP